MGRYVEMKHKYNTLKIKYSIASQIERKKMEMHDINEYYEYVIKEMEVASGRKLKDLLNGSDEEYSDAFAQVLNREYMLHKIHFGRSYLMYKNKFLKPYLNVDGSYNIELMKKKEEESDIHVEVIEQKNSEKVKVVNQLQGANASAAKIEFLDREDLKEYFPHFKKIEQCGNTNMIFLEHDEFEWDTTEVSETLFWSQIDYLDKNTFAKTKEAHKILEKSLEYASECAVDVKNSLECAKWKQGSDINFANFYEMITNIARGSQHYINDYIDKVEDDTVKNQLKKYSYTTILSTINPIGPNIGTFTENAKGIKYQEQSEREVVYTANYDQEEFIQKMIKNGDKVNILGIKDNQYVVIKKYNQD